MAVKFIEVSLLVLVVISVFLAACSCGPVSSEKPTSDDLENSASLSEEGSNASKLPDAKTTAETVIELRTKQRVHSNHRRSHKKRKNGSKRLHLQMHLLLHSPQPSDIPVSHAAPSLHVSAKTLDLYMQRISASFVSQLRYEYAQAYKADHPKGIKTTRIGGKAKAASPSVATRSLNASSLQPTQSTTGTPTISDDPCALWENCAVNQNANVSRWLQELPSCPCRVQLSKLFYNRTLYDEELDKYFDWGYMKVDKLAILRGSAEFCIRQRFSLTSPSLSAQVCCYDSNMTLITRGVDAGTPFLVSPDWNRELHFKHDELPIRLCNGDWTRFHAVRSPNNGRNCTKNPDDAEYARQVAKARDY